MGNIDLSIVIPSVDEPYLQKTIDDIRKNAEGSYEIIVALDGVDVPVKGARVIKNKKIGLRNNLNMGMNAARGEYIAKCDAHNCFAKGFDRVLLKNIKDNWVVVPRRYTLDVEKWRVMDIPPVDYERLSIEHKHKIGGAVWRSRRRRRKHIKIDENMVCQGSFYVMSKKHWKRLGNFDDSGYGPFTQEPIEICLKTWLGPWNGRVMVNKNTWYAHRHRKFGRVYAPPYVKQGNLYSRDYWLNNKWEGRVHDLVWLMERFGL